MISSQHPLVQQGRFVLGVNYWASHAGTQMWSQWDAQIVEEDLARLAKFGIQTLRVFPLWSDFQPIQLLRQVKGQPQEMRMGEEPFPNTPAGKVGISQVMMDRFATLTDCAQKHGLTLSVGLVTGWMSGRMFVPRALESLNLLTDPLAVQWQVRFVKHFVKTFKHHEAIIAWGLGNECNCLGPIDNREQAWNWTATISHAIASQDTSRPIVSGMHSLRTDTTASPWRIEDQAELTDVLTTHPYPIFTPYCDLESINTIRSIIHSTAESRLYADVGNKPCLVEELGTLGPAVANPTVAGDYLRSVLFSLWANDCHGLFWWCAYDQSHLTRAPYDWNSVERELGLFDSEKNPKPVVTQMQKFGKWLAKLPIQTLPPRKTQAVCLLSDDQDTWPITLATAILSKQAGFDLRFQNVNQPLEDAPLYLLPAAGRPGISRRRYLELVDKVKAGASLYISTHDGGFLCPFKEVIGAEPVSRERRSQGTHALFTGLSEQPRLWVPVDDCKTILDPCDTTVLATQEDGLPIFTSHDLGQGKVYFLGFSPERYLAKTPSIVNHPQENPYWRIYEHIAKPLIAQRLVRKDHPLVGVTEHALDDGRWVVVAVNYSPEKITTTLELAEGQQLRESWYGQAQPGDRDSQLHLCLNANDAWVGLVSS